MSSIAAWTNVRKIADGMKVDAEHTNSPIGDLEARDNHLLALINALHLGESVYAREVPLAPGMQVGMLVYYDAAARTYQPAAAALSSTGDSAAQSAYAVGVLAQIHTATVGTLITSGKVVFDSTPKFIDSPEESGLRYVSTVPGRMAAEPPGIKLPVGMWQAAEKTLMFHPASAAMVEGHTHYRFELVASPAGEVEDTYLEPHTFVTANPALPGWLPAQHPVFGGLAPAGAKFGYNLARHQELLAVFPPAPIDGAVVEVYLDGAGATRAPDDLVKLTATGIWWMRDDWGWAPWQMSPNAFVSEPPLPGVDDPVRPPPVGLQYGQGYVGVNNVCPTRVFLWFTRPTFFTGAGVVQSLTAEKNTPYRITDCAGKEASTGNLRLGFELDAVQEDDQEDTGYALSRVKDNKFLRYSSVSKISSSSNAIKVDGGTLLPDGSYSGHVKISFDDPTRSREVSAALFALDHARQDQFQNMFYMALPASMTSSVRGRVDIPFFGNATDMAVALELCLFVTLPGTLPDLFLSYRRMRQPAARTALGAPNNNAEVALPNLVLNEQLDTGISRANMYFNAASATLPASAGDTIYFTVRRGNDSYTGDIGIIRAKAVIQ